jgi:hypothetical protein
MDKQYIFRFSIYVVILSGYWQIYQPSLCAQDATPLFEEDQCIACHIEMELMPENFHENDIHLQAGLSCAGCHGGDPASDDAEISMDPKAGFIGVPQPSDIPKLCGKCHSSIDYMRIYQPRISTDQVQQYYTSIHGRRLSQGDTKVAECVSCHSAHSIMPSSDPRSTTHPLNVPAMCSKCHSDKDYMKEYNLPVDQYEEYAISVHGQELLEHEDTGSPACNDCHGNHGATPPGLESVSHVCGHCHVNNAEYFQSSAMAQSYEEMEIHACEQCHGYHEVKKTSDEMVGTGDESVCLDCHSSGDKGYQTAETIYNSIKDFVSKYDMAEQKLKEVQIKGMDDVDILFLLQEANQTLIHTRTLVHTFDAEKIKTKIDEGGEKTAEALTLANKEIKDYHVRRRGFGVATIFITVLVIAMFFKIRAMEKKS